MKSKVTATKDNVVLKLRPMASDLGIVIPDGVEPFDPFWEVHSVGPDVEHLEVGDIVAAAVQFGTISFEWEKVKYTACKADCVLCKLGED